MPALVFLCPWIQRQRWHQLIRFTLSCLLQRRRFLIGRRSPVSQEKDIPLLTFLVPLLHPALHSLDYWTPLQTHLLHHARTLHRVTQFQFSRLFPFHLRIWCFSPLHIHRTYDIFKTFETLDFPVLSAQKFTQYRWLQWNIILKISLSQPVTKIDAVYLGFSQLRTVALCQMQYNKTICFWLWERLEEKALQF